MDNKLILLNLIDKYRGVLHSNHDYVVCNQLLAKISASMIINVDNKLDFNELVNLSTEEMEMFSSPECKRIITALKQISNMKGWRVDTVVGLIKQLQKDILENKMNYFITKDDSLDELQKIIEQGLFKDNYNLVLEFIKTSFDSKLLSYTEAINLNFYILKSSNVHVINDVLDDQIEDVILTENLEPDSEVRKKLKEIFSKYGYVYDEKRMGDLDNKFVKYASVDYVDYILSKFKDYGIDLEQLYSRKWALYTIIISNDKEVFNTILDFIDKNKCSLDTLLGIPAVFNKRKRNYIERSKRVDGVIDSVYKVSGSHQDFLDNIALYKKLSGVSMIGDSDLNRISVFLCTSSKIVNKNLGLLERYGIISNGKLPKAIVALCGRNTEYIIDRIIELGLFESYLSPRVTLDGQIKQPRGTYFLDGDSNPFKFYKMKRANDFGEPILASNGGIRKVFRDNSESYMGILYNPEADGNVSIVQEPLSLTVINGISPNMRKGLPVVLQHQLDTGKIPMSEAGAIHFNNLYKYKTFSPVEVFAASDRKGETNLKGDRVDNVFMNDYKEVITDEELKNVTSDKFVKSLDEAFYCNVYGESRPLKTSELKYEFSHPSFPNVHVVISRYKVLRLCKLLKEAGCWIGQESSLLDKENTLLAVILKDTIISETEMIMLRFAVRQILSNGLIKVSIDDIDTKDRRGAR